VLEAPLLQLVYVIDLSTLIHGEHLSLEAVAHSIGFAPTEECQIFLATQTLDEARHLEVFTRRLSDLGLDRARRETLLARFHTASVQKFHDLVRENLDKRDFLGATIALNVSLEGLAYPVYRYETPSLLGLASIRG
jgi:hypothetical protein